ncbi:hypothetical protein [Sphingobium yanoikuyae]|uniref:hypothetical protein n=1 Tax=Sphingobium yanoikuyae TaxID=13690 RepID=UPI0035C765EE
MPFYLVEQKGVPGVRFVEADKPATAINHVVGDSFSCTRVDGRDLVNAARQYECELAGGPKASPEPEPEKLNGTDEPQPAAVNGADEPAVDDEPVTVDQPEEPEAGRTLASEE